MSTLRVLVLCGCCWWSSFATETPVAITAGGYPRAIEASGMRFLCTGTGGRLVVTVSPINASLTSPWSHRGVVVQDQQPGVDLANCVLFATKTGLLAAYRHHFGCTRHPTRETQDLVPRICTNYTIQVSESTDFGRTWAHLSTPIHGAVGMWEPFFIQTTAGVQLAYAQEVTNGGLQSIVWQLTRDLGMSWGRPVTISDGAEHTSRDGMPGLARLPDNSIVLVFEGFWAHGMGHFSVQMRRSRDEGVTWDAGGVIYATSDRSANAGAPQIAVANGVVWVSFMCDEDSDPADRAWPSDAATKVMTANISKASIDFGDGDNRVTIGVGPGALWPGLAVLDRVPVALFGRGGSSYLEVLRA
jgi:hypothetical protein